MHIHLITLALPLAVLAHSPRPNAHQDIVRRAAHSASSSSSSSSAAPVVAKKPTTSAPVLAPLAATPAPAPTTTTPAAAKKPKAAVTAAPSAGVTTAVVAGTSTFATSSLATTYPPGSTPTAVKGAPPLPNWATINPADYPALDLLPPIDSAQMKQWISEIDMTGIPNIPPTGLGGCANTTYNAQAIKDATTNCWWTCAPNHCTRDTDISFCPNKGTWGLSYDDGPSPSTPKLLDFLDSQNLLATFFVVGSRAVSRPEMLQNQYMAGHQISVHTWAHSSLTTLSNEGIIAELAWSKAIIKAVTGVTPNTMRPPYGDIDDRVRYISMQLGLTPIIWTVAGDNSYDTQDWQIADGGVSAAKVLKNFETIINGSTSLNTGFIVLEHDLEEQSVDLAVEYVLPQALDFTPTLTLEPIITCLGQDLSQAYMETYVTPNVAQAALVNSSKASSAVKAAGSTVSGAGSGSTAGAGRVSGIGMAALMGVVAVGFAALAW
ncbi:hypothetical protein P7C70_g4116, partial [Phenoliferia sp. Uapishka_3]